MGLLAGKRILLTGLLSNRSIAYGIAQACKREGAELAFTYAASAFKDRITEFATEFGSDLVFPCDVADDAQIDALFASLKARWDGLDGLVHSIGFAPREAIAGDFLDGMTREKFRIAHDISAYSFLALAKAAPLHVHAGRVVAHAQLSRCRRAIPNYNTMGLPSLARSDRALSGGVSLGLKACASTVFRRADQDAGRERHQGLWQDSRVRRTERAAQAQRDDRTGWQFGGVSAVRSRGRCDGGNRACR